MNKNQVENVDECLYNIIRFTCFNGIKNETKLRLIYASKVYKISHLIIHDVMR